jgi:hypothetical protein
MAARPDARPHRARAESPPLAFLVSPHSIKAQPIPLVRTPPRRKVRRSRPIADRERIAARHPDSQTAEIQIRVALINRFNSLGTAEIIRAA